MWTIVAILSSVADSGRAFLVSRRVGFTTWGDAAPEAVGSLAVLTALRTVIVARAWGWRRCAIRRCRTENFHSASVPTDNKQHCAPTGDNAAALAEPDAQLHAAMLRVHELQEGVAQYRRQVAELSTEVSRLREALAGEQTLGSELHSRALMLGAERRALVEQAEAAIAAERVAQQALQEAKLTFAKDLEVASLQAVEWQRLAASLQQQLADCQSRLKLATREGAVSEANRIKQRIMMMLRDIDDGLAADHGAVTETPP